MKKKLLLLQIVIPLMLLGQEYDKAYFNKEWLLTSIDSAIYYRISGFNDSVPEYDGVVIDYYLKTDSIQMVGYYKNGYRNGEFKFFFPNGKERLIINYLNNERTGFWKEFYDNGNVKIELKYEDDNELLIQLNNEDGNTLIKKNKVDYEFNETEPPRRIWEVPYPIIITKRIKGKLVNDIRNGKWVVYYNNVEVSTLIYKNGNLIDGYLLVNSQKLPITNSLAFSLMNDPIKLTVTESLFLQPGAIIKNNYVVDALNTYKIRMRKKTKINSNQELIDYINYNFVLKSRKDESVIKIIIYMTDKESFECTTIPRLSSTMLEELNSVLSTVEILNLDSSDSLILDYIITKEENLNLK